MQKNIFSNFIDFKVISFEKKLGEKYLLIKVYNNIFKREIFAEMNLKNISYLVIFSIFVLVEFKFYRAKDEGTNYI